MKVLKSETRVSSSFPRMNVMAKKPGFFLSGTVPFGKNPGFLLFPPDECDGKETRLLFDLDIQVSFIYYPLNSQSAKPFAFLKKTSCYVSF